MRLGFYQAKTDELFGLCIPIMRLILSSEGQRVIRPLYQSWDWGFMKWRSAYHSTFVPIMRLSFYKVNTDILFDLCTNQEIGFLSSEDRRIIQPLYQSWD